MTTDPTPEPARPLADAPIVIVTGMSGAGRSTAANVLEDLGWLVVDNLPPQLLGSNGGSVRVASSPLRRTGSQLRGFDDVTASA